MNGLSKVVSAVTVERGVSSVGVGIGSIGVGMGSVTVGSRVRIAIARISKTSI